MQQTMTAEVRFGQRKATGCNPARRAARRLGRKREVAAIKFICPTPDQAEVHAQPPQSPKFAGSIRRTAITLSLLLVFAPSLSSSWAASPGSPSPAESEVSLEPLPDPQKIQIAKLQADLQKTQAEVVKTKAEVENLQLIGPDLNKFITISTSLGGLAGAVFGAVLAALVAWLGQRINRNYNKAQGDKLRQDRELEHEKHSLELYKSLGSDSSRGQFAAAAVLLQRLEHLSGDRSAANDGDAHADRITIVQVLISVLKEQIDDPNSTVLRKHIADNIVKALKLVAWNGHPKGSTSPSFLADFDLQKCKLKDVFWRGVNLRSVDLYGSDLSGASLRCADLRGAVLYQSTLVGCKFNDANLERANLEGACIDASDFSGANLIGIKLFDAKFNDRTKWPSGFDPIALGAVQLEASVLQWASVPC